MKTKPLHLLALFALFSFPALAEEQTMCPIMVEDGVDEEEFVEYKGKKIYFFKERDIERKWNIDPDAKFAEAREAGLLPQYDE